MIAMFRISIALQYIPQPAQEEPNRSNPHPPPSARSAARGMRRPHARRHSHVGGAMAQHDDPIHKDYPLGRGYGHDYMRGGEVFGGYGYSARDEYELPRGELKSH